jgi:hypothetical protein
MPSEQSNLYYYRKGIEFWIVEGWAARSPLQQGTHFGGAESFFSILTRLFDMLSRLVAARCKESPPKADTLGTYKSRKANKKPRIKY